MTQPTIEVLIERVTNLITGLERLESNLADQNRVTARLPVLERDVHDLSQEVQTALTLSTANSNAAIANKTIMRIVGTIASAALVASVSFAGWAWNQLDLLHRADNDAAVRLTKLEVRNDEADKLKGYIRAEH